MHNPLRSEADAFRWLVVIAVGAASVVAVTLLTRPVVGVIWMVLLIGFGVGFGYHSARGSLPRNVEVTQGGDGKFRLLVIANETVQGEELRKEIGDRCRDRRCEVMVVTPALASSRTSHWTSDIDEAIELARQRMELSLIEIKQLGLKAKGEIGDSDPNIAIEDALRVFPADEILISTHPPDRSRWLEHGVVDKAREQIDLPITHVVVDLATGRALL
jgi:hypothetical protein